MTLNKIINQFTKNPSPQVKYAIAISDLGKKRQLNEDSILIDESLGFYIVADGMGGHKAGEIASHLAVKIMHQQIKKYENIPDLSAEKISSIIENAVTSTNQQINSQNIQQGVSEGQGMGTTITGFWAASQKIYAFNLGDSRCYSFYQGKLHQLSIDHSHYQLWLETGKVGKAPKKNIIYKAIGPWKKVVVDQFTHQLSKNEMILLCSDGLTDMLEDNKICAILTRNQHKNIRDCAQDLISMANMAGGKDNVSVILFKP